MTRLCSPLAALLMSASAWGQVQLTVETLTSDLVEGEPLRLTYRITNHETKPLTTDLCLAHECGRISLEISTGKKSHSYRSIAMDEAKNTGFGDVATLAAGQTKEHDACVGFDETTGSPAFAAPGTYEIVASFTLDPKTQLAAKAVTVSVGSATGDNALELAALQKLGLEHYLCEDARYYGVDDATKKALLSFREQYPASPYTQGVEAVLRAIGVLGKLVTVPDEVVFGDVPVAMPITVSVSLSNLAEQGDVTVSSIGGLDAPFGLGELPALPLTLTPDTALIQALPVTFQPPDTAPYTDWLFIDTSYGRAIVQVQGQGSTSPRLGLATGLVDFGAVKNGDVAHSSFVLTNLGVDALQIEGFSPLADPFSYGQLPSLPYVLQSQESKTIEVTFKARTGRHRATVMVRSNDAWSQPAHVGVVGSGGTAEGCGCALGEAPQLNEDLLTSLWLLALLLPWRRRS